MDTNKYPTRKTNRLSGYDYSSAGGYFVTICTDNKKCLLGRVAGGDNTGIMNNNINVRDYNINPCCLELSKYGVIAEKYLNSISNSYSCVTLEQYVIMPNHIHLLLIIENDKEVVDGNISSLPQTSKIPAVVAAFKRFTNLDTGTDIWQRSYHDRIIRNRNEYQKVRKYIYENPMKWREDCFFASDI